MSIPSNLKYSEEHEWIRVEDGDTAYVGVTNFAQEELGDIVYVSADDELDEEVEQNETFGSIETVKAVAELYIPVTATVLEANEALEDNPELVNEDPYGEGWIIKVKMSDSSQLDSLMDAAAYEDFVAKSSS